jgi:hypothetical protein
MVDLNGQQYFSDEGQPSGLRAAGGGLVEGLSFDFATEILEVGGSDEQISLTISPL